MSQGYMLHSSIERILILYEQMFQSIRVNILLQEYVKFEIGFLVKIPTIQNEFTLYE